jgi:hypothetical protein
MANANAERAADKAPEKTVTVVVNNREGLEIFQLPHRGSDKHGRVILGPTVTLLPGLNLLETEELAALREHPLFVKKLTLAIPKSKAPEQKAERVGRPYLEIGKELPAAYPLAKLPIPEALGLVEEANELQLAAFG